MDLRAAEAAGIFGNARGPVMAIGNAQSVIVLHLAGRERDGPAATRLALRLFNPGVEADMLPQAEVIDVIVEVAQQQRMVRIVRPIGRHRIVLKGQPPLGCVDVQALIAGAHPVGIVVIPGPADIVRSLIDIERDTVILQPFGSGKAGAPCPDDAHLGHRCSLGHRAHSPGHFGRVCLIVRLKSSRKRCI